MSIVKVKPRINPSNGCTAYWELDEASGDMLDATGNGHTITASGSPVSGAGYIGPGRAFLAASSQFGYIASGDATAFDPAGSFTIRARVFPTILGGVEKDIFTKNNNTSQREWYLFYNSTNIWRFSVSLNNTASVVVSSTLTPAISGWTDIFAGFDISLGKIWITANGEPLVLNTFVGPISASTTALAIAASTGGTTGRFTGVIDTVGYWNRRLTWDEIRYLDRSTVYPFRN